MLYSIKFRLDIKKNVYVSKKVVNAEPYYQISALIRINKGATIHYYTGYSAQQKAWFGSAIEASKGDGNRLGLVAQSKQVKVMAIARMVFTEMPMPRKRKQ